jgi:tetrahydromethanopterin S-methyltransferase subunit E
MQSPEPFSPQPASAAQDIHRQATTWLGISLASSVFCVSLCLGIGGAVFCYLALQAAAQGLTVDAEAKLRWGKILTLVGSGIGILTTILTLIFR